MYKRIIPILVLLLTLGATDVSAQNLLNTLKKKAKEKAEQVIDEALKGDKSKEKSESNGQRPIQKTTPAQPAPQDPGQTAAAQKTSAQPTIQTSTLTPPPATSTALFEPIGHPTENGKLEGTFTLPSQGEKQQVEWANAQPAPAKLSNKRLVEEYKALDAWLKAATFTTKDEIVGRRENLDREISLRANTLEKFVDGLQSARETPVAAIHVNMFARTLEGNEYKRTINSPLVPLEPYLPERVIRYFETNGGLANARSGEKTKWQPSQTKTVGTSSEGVTGTVTQDGMIDVGGVLFRVFPTENKAVLWATYAEVLVDKDVVIPSHIQMDGKSYPVREIRGQAFSNNEIRSVVIPNTVKVIGSNAFAIMPRITSIEIPNSVTELTVACFHSCANLREIHVPNSVKRIGGGCFANCPKLTTVTLPQAVSHFDQGQFENCPSLVNVTLPANLKEIRDRMFYGCKALTSITIPETVTKIKNRAFDSCTSLTSITIPASVAEIEPNAFWRCKALKSVTLSSKFRDLAKLSAIFKDCGLIKPGATEIPDNFHFVD